MRWLVLTILLAPLAYAQDAPTSAATETEESATQMADALQNAGQLASMFAGCEGFFTFMAEFSNSSGKPAGADYIRTFANGSRTAALWLLAAKYAADNPSKPPRRLGEFASLVEGPAEVERLRFTALAEAGDIEPIEQQSKLCTEALAAFDPILQQLRTQTLAPKP